MKNIIAFILIVISLSASATNLDRDELTQRIDTLAQEVIAKGITAEKKTEIESKISNLRYKQDDKSFLDACTIAINAISKAITENRIDDLRARIEAIKI